MNSILTLRRYIAFKFFFSLRSSQTIQRYVEIFFRKQVTNLGTRARNVTNEYQKLPEIENKHFSRIYEKPRDRTDRNARKMNDQGRGVIFRKVHRNVRSLVSYCCRFIVLSVINLAWDHELFLRGTNYATRLVMGSGSNLSSSPDVPSDWN